jgi:SNF2 family DNA or RNA helicase
MREFEEAVRAAEEAGSPRRRAEAEGRSIRSAAPPEWARFQKSLRVQLHPYQTEGVLFAARTRRALLADDMGLGKTIQAAAAARLLMEMGEVARAVVVCPASLKHQWAREIRKCLEGSEAVVLEGGRRAREAIYRESRAPFLVLNYELLVKDLPLVRALAPDLVIVDEAQRIKNWNTRTAKAVKALRTERALVLTGTPMENRLSELHSVVEHLDPRVLGPMWRLGPEFAETEVAVEGARRVRVVGFRGLDLIRRRLAKLFLRRERSAVLAQLPPRTDQTFSVPFTREQAVPHAEHHQNAARIAAKKFLTEADVLRLMAELTSMRMIANGLLLYEWEKVETVVRRGELPRALLDKHPSPKLHEFACVLEELLAQRGTKVVVFSQWERMLRLAAAAARPAMEAARVRPLFFHGQLSSKERAEAVADFHEDPAARVFFSTDAGGVGLNLQEAATAMVHLEVPWNPAVLEQRVGRIHRMGQKRPIQVVSLVSEACIESRIAQVVEHKRALFDGLFRGDSDEVRFDDEGRGSLVEKMRELLGEAPKAPPNEAIIATRRAVDEEVKQAKQGVAELRPAPVEPAPPVASTAELQLDLGGVARGLLGLLGAPAPVAPVALPITVRRRDGKIAVELPGVPEEAWRHLQSFVAALGAR